jgi:hypothetical protein
MDYRSRLMYGKNLGKTMNYHRISEFSPRKELRINIPFNISDHLPGEDVHGF